MFDLGNARAQLARKVGPLPLGAWLAIVAVGVAATIVIRRRLSPAPPAASTSTADTTATEAPTDKATGGYLPGGFVIGAPGGGAVAGTGQTGSTGSNVVELFPDTGAPKTNDDWQVAATRLLIADGFGGSAIADAMTRFFAGMAVTSQQRSMIDRAYSRIGPPPSPVPPVTTIDEGAPEGSPGGGGSAPPPPPAPVAWSPPSSWTPTSPNGYTFVKAQGDPSQTATYVVRPNGIEWISSFDELMRTGGFTSAGQAIAAVRIVPVSQMRDIPRLGTLPPPGSDASLVA